MKTIHLSELRGKINFTGQLRFGPYCGFFKLSPGEYRVEVNVIEGKMSFNHSAYNCDGGTYSAYPFRQTPHHKLSAGESLEQSIIIGESFGYPDRLEIVNTSMTKPLVCSYNIYQT